MGQNKGRSVPREEFRGSKWAEKAENLSHLNPRKVRNIDKIIKVDVFGGLRLAQKIIKLFLSKPASLNYSYLLQVSFKNWSFSSPVPVIETSMFDGFRQLYNFGISSRRRRRHRRSYRIGSSPCDAASPYSVARVNRQPQGSPLVCIRDHADEGCN